MLRWEPVCESPALTGSLLYFRGRADLSNHAESVWAVLIYPSQGFNNLKPYAISQMQAGYSELDAADSLFHHENWFWQLCMKRRTKNEPRLAIA